MNTPDRIVLETADSTLTFDAATGRLISLRPHAAPEAQFIASDPDDPAFVIEYLDELRTYQRFTSFDADTCGVRCDRAADDRVLTMQFTGIGGLALELTATVRASRTEPFSRWTFELTNHAGLEIVDVQFPFIIASYAPSGAPAGEALLLPHNTGRLIEAPGPGNLRHDAAEAWEFRWDNGNTNHYPGSVFAQFMAYYNDDAGLYLACDDTEGYVKLMKALHHEPGLRLGVAHVGDWPADGARKLEYDVLLGTFTGDWYAAADIYRKWSLQQKWATPLHQRDDLPAWLTDSPPHITLRLQGVLDDGPVFSVEEVLPYEKAIPLRERVAERVEGPRVAVIM